MYHDKSSATTHTCTLQISKSHMSHSTTSMRHTQSPVRVQTHDTVTSKLNQPCAHILHVYQCCVQLIRTHFCVYTAFTRNCAPVVLTLNSSISNKIYYIIIYHIYMSPAITMNKAQCLPIIGKRSKKGLTLTATNGSASMSCWKSKHRRPSLSRKSVRKQSSNLSSRFRGSSALVMGRDKDSNMAHRFTDENLLHCTQLKKLWHFRGVHFENDCPSTGTKKTCVILCQTFVVASIPLKPLTTCRAWELYKGPCQRVSPMPPLPNDNV